MAESTVDQVARDGIAHALAKIDRHEAVCMERWGKWKENVDLLHSSLESLRRGVEGLYNRLWYIACAFIAILVSALGTLIVKAFLPHP